MILRLFLISLCLGTVHSIIIDTENGQLEGKTVTAPNGKITHMFKHVPHAQPPVGKLRFVMPKAPLPWKGVRDAKEYGPACMTNSTTSQSPQKWVDEDCLHVNVFMSDDCLKSSKKCPVVFYMHGGGLTSDSAVMFKDDYIVKNFAAEDVVLVITAFRQGFTSLITLPNDNIVPRNLAVYDIIHSLKWVQQNIHSFGGDNTQVSLFGHSGGAVMASILSFSKSIDPEKKLFHRTVAMSSGPYFEDELTMIERTWEFAYRAKCSPMARPPAVSDNFAREIVECLRTRDAYWLLGIQRQMELDGIGLSGILFSGPLFPAKDLNDFVLNPPARPYITGTTSRELDIRDPHDKPRNIYYIPAMQDYKFPFAVADKYFEEMNSTDKDPRIFSHVGDTQYIFMATWRMAHEMRKTGAPVYLYRYANPKHPKHTDDLSYILGIHYFEPDENEAVLAKLYPKYFINFCKGEVPDKDWELLDNDDTYFSIDVDVKTGMKPFNEKNYEKDVIDYWTVTMKSYDNSLVVKHQLTNLIQKRDLQFESSSCTEPCIIINYSYWNYFYLILFSIIIGVFVGRITKSKKIIVVDPNESTPLFTKPPEYDKLF